MGLGFYEGSGWCNCIYRGVEFGLAPLPCRKDRRFRTYILERDERGLEVALSFLGRLCVEVGLEACVGGLRTREC